MHLGARRVMRFEMIGVKFDQAGHQQVAARSWPRSGG